MLSISQIKQMAMEAGRKAAQQKKEPFIYWKGDDKYWPPFPFPNIGDYRPRGWKLVKEYFVDSSGLGAEDEPALTHEAFIKMLKPDRGYAITEVGEFQVYVGEFIQETEKEAVTLAK